EVADAASPGDRRREGEEQEIAAGHEGIGQAVLLHLEGGLAGQRGLADLAQRAEVDEVVLAQDRKPLIQLDSMALAIVESDGLDMRKSVERPGQAGRRILST